MTLSADVVDFSTPSVGRSAVQITHGDRAAFNAEIDGRLRSRQGFSIATINLDHLVKLHRDPAFLAAYRAHSHVVADGKPIIWLSRLAGRTIDLIPGSELVEPIVGLAAGANVPVAFLGSTPEVLDAAAERLMARYPGLAVPCRIAPPFGLDPDDPELITAFAAQIETSGAGLCLLALGAPKQERLAAKLAERLPQVGFLSIGAGLDFIAGKQTRAPVWVRKLALEWVWRLLGNPRRLAARYGACIAIMPRLTAMALRQRRAMG